MNKHQDSGELASFGVEALIERLRQQGVESGRAEAERIEREARRHAAEIEQAAEAKAKRILDEAVAKADSIKNGGKDALKVAMRDTVLLLRTQMQEAVSDQVRRLITAEMDKPEFLRQLIRDIAGQVRERAGVDQGEKITIYVPRKLVEIEELRHNPLQLHEGGLTHFVLSVAGETFKKGITIGVSDDPDLTGIRVYLAEKKVTIDFTDASVAELLLAHLQPRFRAVLEGTVK